MRKSMLAAAAAALLIYSPAPSLAQDGEALVKSVPPAVFEVLSAGSWSEGGKGGIYRATVVMAGEKGHNAEVFIQWLAFDEGASTPSIVATVPFKEANDQKLQNAFVDMGGDKDNEIFITVNSYDPIEDEDISLTARATSPGKYELADTPPIPDNDFEEDE
jgi:hypothetical protein